MKKTKIPFAFRPAVESDHNYILKSWVCTWQQENKQIPTEVFYSQANPLFQDILSKFGATIVCNSDNPSQIYGFAVSCDLEGSDEWVLLWITVKSLYTGLGIGTELYDYIRQGRGGPICPFVRSKSRKYMKGLDAIEMPLLLPKLLNV